MSPGLYDCKCTKCGNTFIESADRNSYAPINGCKPGWVFARAAIGHGEKALKVFLTKEEYWEKFSSDPSWIKYGHQSHCSLLNVHVICTCTCAAKTFAEDIAVLRIAEDIDEINS